MELALVFGVNVLLGIPGVIPTWMVWYFFVSWPLAMLGLTRPDPTENDGPLGWFVLALPIVLASIAVWVLVGRFLWGRVGGSRRPTFWALSVTGFFVPTLLLILAPSLL